ncbi:MAG: Holliday junction branch migration protein RuvA [Patescibacteria group bacterium]|nr:Holliday junction branch migration protein RuvA [Patescibacteria group bacterium]
MAVSYKQIVKCLDTLMLSYLKGKIIFRGKDFVIIESNKIGFKVFILANLNTENDELELFTHLVVREDALTLYGFSNYEELELFELLISISGIGPKAGLGILSLADPKTVKVAIAKGDASILTRVSGIGKKTAERVILELGNKFSISDVNGLEEKSKEINNQTDAIDALVSLGYNINEAKKALSEVPSEIKDVGERIRVALKGLGKK